MKTETLNKMSKEGREKVIELEAKLSALDMELDEMDLLEEHLDKLEKNSGEHGFLGEDDE